MRLKLICLLLLSSTALPVLAQHKFPADVARFVEKRDGYDHFRGEEPYDEERKQFLIKNINALCTGTDAKLAQLKKKYAQRAAIMRKLNDYDAQIEDGQP
ncbi:hypothetical protein D3C72_84840 [compost metagenome]